MMRRIFLILVFLILQVACSHTELTPASLAATPAQPADSTLSPQEPEQFQVKVWLDNPTPPLNSRIVVRGSLINYGSHYVGGIMMSAFWPDERNERGVPNCFALVTYGDGKCVIDVSRFPAGKFVPITVSFNYGGETYTAQTGFTPQAP